LGLSDQTFYRWRIKYNRRRRHSTLGYLSPEQFETITHHHQLEKLQTA
jgi:transposase InsO family protein